MYDNPIPNRCLAPIDCLKIPAQASITKNRFLERISEPVFKTLLRGPGIDSQPGGFDSWANPPEPMYPGWESIPGLLIRFPNTGPELDFF